MFDYLRSNNMSDDLAKIMGIEKYLESIVQENKKEVSPKDGVLADINIKRAPDGDIILKYRLCPELYNIIKDNTDRFESCLLSNGESYMMMNGRKDGNLNRAIYRSYINTAGGIISGGSYNHAPLLAVGSDKGVEIKLPGLYTDRLLNDWITVASKYLNTLYTEFVSPISFECTIKKV